MKINNQMIFNKEKTTMDNYYNDINSMSGIEFEFLCKDLLEKMGFETETTKASGDGGIDLIAYNYQPILSGKYIIQCKRYIGSVGEPIIRDLYGVVTSERANKGILITTGYFTNSAINFAKEKPIELIDGNKLNDLLTRYGINNQSMSTCKNGDNHYFGGFSHEYARYKELLRKDSLDYESLQKTINLFMQSIVSNTKSGNYSPTKQEYNGAIDECIFHLSRISLYNSSQCIYAANYCRSILYLLKGDLKESYIYSKQTIEIISKHINDSYTSEEVVSILSIVYNHIQLCILLNFESEAKSTYEKWQDVFLKRIDDLNNQIADDSLDWADPDEDINDVLEFMESENQDAIIEIDFLSNPFTLSSIYLVDTNLIFFYKELPKEFFSLSLFDEYSVIKASFDIENNKITGISGFPKWDNYHIL